jgi:hypothetical protein
MSALDSSLFCQLKHLGHLKLTCCGLLKVNVDAFKGLENLVLLSLIYNRLKRFESGTFDCLPSLQHLFLDNNLCKSFQPGLFKELTKLEDLYLEGNPLKAAVDLNEDTFVGLASLKTLHLFNTPTARAFDRSAAVFAKHLRSDLDIKLQE